MTEQLQDGLGRCPGCDRKGAIGAPCTTVHCLKLGIHIIPEEYWQRWADRSGGGRGRYVGRQVDGYLLVDNVGRGGFATVYLALQGTLRIPRAFKLMSISDSDVLRNKVVRKFLLEAEILARLDHPGIVRLIHHGRLDHTPFIVMEYVDAPSLYKVMLERGEANNPFSRGEVLDIMNQILLALDSAHRKGLVHRDIKPENLLLQGYPGKEIHVRIVDFGLAKYYLESPNSELVVGTPTYMSPEALWKMPVSPASDIYSTSMTFFHMLAGLPGMYSATAAHVPVLPGEYDYRQLIRGLDIKLPWRLHLFLSKGLQHVPGKRFPDARTMKKALDRIAHLVPDAKWPPYRPDWKNRPESLMIRGDSYMDASQEPTEIILAAGPDDETLDMPEETVIPSRAFSFLRTSPLLVTVAVLMGVELLFPTRPVSPPQKSMSGIQPGRYSGSRPTLSSSSLQPPAFSLRPPASSPRPVGREDCQSRTTRPPPV